VLRYTTVQMQSLMLVRAAKGFFQQHGSCYTFLIT
jgi:hypothetical protein